MLTVWDVATPTSFVHDIISTDKRTPTLNANGLIFGVDYHNGLLVIADPVKNTNQVVPFPTLDDKRTMGNPAFGAAANRVEAVPPRIGRPPSSTHGMTRRIRTRSPKTNSAGHGWPPA